MNWLARLKGIGNATDTGPTKPTKPTFVGFVGAYYGHFQNSEDNFTGSTTAYSDPENDLAASTDTDTARRLALFTDRGLSMADADDLAQRLTQRDLELDERRVCLECKHLSGGTDTRRCSQWRTLQIGSAAIPADLVATLQRCKPFAERLEVVTSNCRDMLQEF